MRRRRVASPEEPTPRACRRARRLRLRGWWHHYACRPPSHPCPLRAAAKAVPKEDAASPERPTQRRGSSPPLPPLLPPNNRPPFFPPPNTPPLAGTTPCGGRISPHKITV